MSHTPMTNGKQVITSHGEQVLFNPSQERQSDQLARCTHEEVDTRMFVHAMNAVRQGCESIAICTVDN